MKYLKRFNESVDKSNISEVIQTIKDILLPITDMGYEVSVKDYQHLESGENELIIRVVNYTDPTLEMDDEVKDEFIRMNDYLGSLGIFSVKALYVMPWLSTAGGKQIKVDFSEFISIDNCELRNLLFTAKVHQNDN
jgi:hypothetical protein